MLQRGASVEMGLFSTGSALHYAVRSCRRDFVYQLIYEQFADLDAHDDKRRAPLMIIGRDCYDSDTAACYSKYGIAKLLLDGGANVNAADFSDNCVLHYAMINANRDLALVRLLLERGADPNRQSEWGTTPLTNLLRHYSDAVIGRDKPLLELLLPAGADPFLTDRNGLSAVLLLDKDPLGPPFMETHAAFFRRS